MIINDSFNECNEISLLKGDVNNVIKNLPDSYFNLIITSPPYNIGKEYERGKRITFSEYMEWLDLVVEQLVEKLAEDGSICWQVGNYIQNKEVFPLDIYFYEMFKKRGLKLRNRIIWHFNFGLHSSNRFSGRYETILWFTKSDNYKFNLDPVRIPQLYPGKRHSKSKGDNAGKPSGNPLGKNPSDFWEFSSLHAFEEQPIWEIPNVKANHPEKTLHPCQFPVELVERCVLAFTEKNDSILDPFVGTGTSLIAGMKHKRHVVGIDKNQDYIELAKKRIEDFQAGTLKIRDIGKSVYKPSKKDKVATIPDEWKVYNEEANDQN